MSFAEKVINSKKPFVLFHTYSVTKDVLKQAISGNKSMDLDVCVDGKGNPYLGHSEEFYEKSGERREENMPLWETVEMIAKSTIPVIVDCKHFDAWPVVEKVVEKIGPERCLVHTFVSELKFNYSRKDGEPDYLTEWSPIEKLRSFKNKFPSVTTTASAKWLPDDLLIPEKYKDLLQNIRQTLKNNSVDTVCLNIPNETFSNESLKYFLAENIIPHIGIDNIDKAKLSEIYIGETDNLKFASKSRF